MSTESDDHNTNLSNLRFADDILFISGSLEHTTTMLRDLTIVTTAHGLQLHPTKNRIVSSPTSKRGKEATRWQFKDEHRGPTARREKYLPQLITFNNAVQVEFEHRIICAWATFTSHWQELTSPKCPPRDRLKLFDATVTRSLLCASGTWTMTEK